MLAPDELHYRSHTAATDFMMANGEPQAWELRVQEELASIAAELNQIEQAARGAATDSSLSMPPADVLQKLAAGMEACERIIEDHAAGKRHVEADTLHIVAIVLCSTREVMTMLIATVR